MLFPLVQAITFAQYHGGPVIHSAQVVPVLLGPNPTSFPYYKSIQHYYAQIMNSPYIDMLNEYNNKTKIIRGKAWTPQYIFTDKSTFDDNDIMNSLGAMVKRGTIKPSVNTIYAVHASPGVAITFSGLESCKTFCAYHSNMGLDDGSTLIYTVIPDTDCALCGGFYNNYNNFGMMASHELVEAITNPDTASGWYAGTSDVQDEIGDICAWQLGTIKGSDGINYPVQKIWSNQKQACIV
ncbi:hypothetical protein HDV04_000605 [Boothiomyces sp. JEL0838]|nr:hypothetical protein HDV04_000605 [Boothiomyces sp. JEL0838]